MYINNLLDNNKTIQNETNIYIHVSEEGTKKQNNEILLSHKIVYRGYVLVNK